MRIAIRLEYFKVITKITNYYINILFIDKNFYLRESMMSLKTTKVLMKV